MMLDGSTPTPACQGAPGPALLQDRHGLTSTPWLLAGSTSSTCLAIAALCSCSRSHRSTSLFWNAEQSSAQARHRRGRQSRDVPAATPQPPLTHTAPLTPTEAPAAAPGNLRPEGGRDISPPPTRRRRRPGPQHPARLPPAARTPGVSPPRLTRSSAALSGSARGSAPRRAMLRARRHLPQVRGAAVRRGRAGRDQHRPPRPAPSRPARLHGTAGSGDTERGRGAVSARRCFPGDVRSCGCGGAAGSVASAGTLRTYARSAAAVAMGEGVCGNRCLHAGVPSFPRSAVRVSLRCSYSAPGNGRASFK